MSGAMLKLVDGHTDPVVANRATEAIAVVGHPDDCALRLAVNHGVDQGFSSDSEQHVGLCLDSFERAGLLCPVRMEYVGSVLESSKSSIISVR
mgnify:CR=1 FL=1